MPVFATYFSPSGPGKGYRNAIMKVGFSDGGFKKQGFLGYSDIISHFLNESKTFGCLVFLCFFNGRNNLFDRYSEGIDFLWAAFMLGRGLTSF